MTDPERAHRVVVAATDFSDLAGLALEAAIAEAARTGATLHVIHVLPPVVIAPVPGLAPPPLGSAMLEAGASADAARNRLEVIEQLRDHVERRIPGGMDLVFEPHVRIGKPAPEIAHLAEQIGADILYLSTHGRSGLRRLVLGSVAESVLRLAPCPVVVMRPKLEVAAEESGTARGTAESRERHSG